ncbi:hypothetical protein [Nannocystis punicea]|uniref:Uncharacterized protein n=1 Tax=Nannocystis punicea TaxID=2995304 RepID=A0ABY7H7N2_9BACT|nr:hypothetical protein [Nannocystis poenicansa]WAS95087.1 hypothetical protein O0S08_02910 [Nannocystis poenicansa]
MREVAGAFGAFSVLIVLSLCLGWWQRRLLGAQLGAGEQAGSALPGAALDR